MATRIIILLITAATLLGSCTSIQHVSRSRYVSGYCDPPQTFPADPQFSYSADTTLLADTLLRQQYSQKDLLLAHAAGITDAIRALDSLQRLPDASQQLRQLALQQHIQLKLMLLSTQISSVAAELDCEGERADQMATYLSARVARRTNLLTISSIAVGAIAGIFTAASNNDQANKVVGISGGAISAGLGVMALFSSRKVIFQHPRNLLRDVWLQSAVANDYPQAVWFILREKHFSNSQDFSISHNIRQRWITFGYVKDGTPDADVPFFGSGGHYNEDDLRTRANMLNELQSSVKLISQDLQILLLKISHTAIPH